jgi:vacuolar-type H+-ATPase subunit E/Vma4
MNEQEMLEKMRTEAKERNENLKKQAAERLRKNAEYNKTNKRKE